MWQIINGNQPIFYLKVWEVGSVQQFMLVDGLQKLLGQPDDFLRVDRDYLLGDYTNKGSIEDKVGTVTDVVVEVKFITQLSSHAYSSNHKLSHFEVRLL